MFVVVAPGEVSAKLEAVMTLRLFATPYRTTQPKLFAFDALGEGGWLRALRLAGYAARASASRGPAAGAVPLPRSPVARIARVRSPYLNRVTLCRTERNKCRLGERNMKGRTNDFQ